MGKKAPKTTPRTTAVNPQAVAHTLTAFSPAHDKATPLYYAHLHAAPDAHTLRVYSIDGKCVSRWASNAHGDEAGEGNSADEEPRVRSIEWCSIPAAATDEAAAQQQAEGKRGKKRRKSDGGSAAVDSPAKPTSDSSRPAAAQLLLALGLENGSILLWQPTGTQARTLSHPASNSPVTALASPAGDDATSHLWSAHQDGSVRVWDLESGNVIGKVAGLAEESRWDDLLVRYEAPAADSGKRTVQIVLSHLSLHVYSVQLGGASKKEGKVRDLKATELGRCTGHVEPCSVRWTGSSASTSAAAYSDKLTFLSYAPTDRFVQVWQIPTAPASSAHIGLLLARLALDSGVASASVSPLAASTSSQTLAAIDSATGNVSLTTLPLSFAADSATPSKKGKKHGLGVVALDVQCEITAPAQSGRNEANVSEVTFRPEEDGKVILCRGGVKPVFEVAAFKEEGSWIPKVELTRGAAGLLTANGAASSSGAPQTTRYSEQSTAAVAATTVATEADSDDDEVIGNAGELDVDMAEPTLADRLKALNVSQKKERKAAVRKQRAIDADDVEVASESDDEDDEDLDLDDLAGDDDDLDGPAVPATTLTTTLIQALHSQDGPLLESCLNHSNPNLVRSTVKRLPSGGLVLSLLEALVERLGKQKKGREGLASVKRARALIAWLRETLIVHVGFLVTIPSLVNRLAALHASLTQRLALQPTLLALNGRLDLVMSQIDLRQDRARAASQRQIAAAAAKKSSSGRRYVEGESTDEDEPHGDGDDEDLSEGDIEDVVLGAGASDDEDDLSGSGDEDASDVDSDFEDEEDGEGGAPRHKRNGVASLLDLEAEDDEDYDEDEEDDEEGEGASDDDDESAGEDSEFEA
ncbi:hypothetical protein JCM10908_002767 [Rhodotorula pacifica]|uniref:Utp5p n=1 Tax=Rhodotorula pacifica TaxID=1495444 RepID=UPI00316B47DB